MLELLKGSLAIIYQYDLKLYRSPFGNCFNIRDNVGQRKPSLSLFLLVVPQVYHPLFVLCPVHNFLGVAHLDT